MKRKAGGTSPVQASQTSKGADIPTVSISASPRQSTQSSDPVEPDPCPLVRNSRKRHAETSLEQLENLAREGIKIFHSVGTDALFDDDVVEVRIGGETDVSQRPKVPGPSLEQTTSAHPFGIIRDASGQPTRSAQTSGARSEPGQSFSSLLRPVAERGGPLVPSPMPFLGDSRWAEHSWNSMLRVGMAHKCIQNIDDLADYKLSAVGLIKLFEAFYAFSKDMLIHKDAFGGGLDRQKEAYQQMKDRISFLEEELKSAPQISPDEKTKLEQALAQAISDKDSTIKEKEAAILDKESIVKERDTALRERDAAIQDKDRAIKASDITRSDLNKATEEITTLTMEKGKFSEQISSLKNLIRTIEKEKADNFSTGLVLARLHTENFPGWEHVDWSGFKPPDKVESPVPSYFHQQGPIKDIVRKHCQKKKNNQPE